MRKTKSAILEAVHETAKGLHKAGVIDLVTLRELDRLRLRTRCSGSPPEF
jgi:putative transcriptional regulator